MYSKPYSLNEVMEKYTKPYESTFIATLGGVTASGLKVNFYDSESGIITALLGGKRLMVIVVPLDKSNTMVRITPADGVYATSATQIQLIFDNIKNSFEPNVIAKST